MPAHDHLQVLFATGFLPHGHCFLWKPALLWLHGLSDGLIALAYLLGAVCMYFTAKSYALMTESVPTAGSVYGFARVSLGVFPGFIAGWMILARRE